MKFTLLPLLLVTLSYAKDQGRWLQSSGGEPSQVPVPVISVMPIAVKVQTSEPSYCLNFTEILGVFNFSLDNYTDPDCSDFEKIISPINVTDLSSTI